MEAQDNTPAGDIKAWLARRIAQALPGEAREPELYRLVTPQVRRYGLRHLRDDHAAVDLMQQVMALSLFTGVASTEPLIP